MTLLASSRNFHRRQSVSIFYETNFSLGFVGENTSFYWEMVTVS